MRVVFVNRYYHPDISATSQILTDLATHLATRHEVHVVASRQRIDEPGAALPPHVRVDGVTVHRVWTSRFGRDRLAGRALDYLTFQALATWRILRLARRGDVVIPMTDPPLMSVPARWAARTKGARVVNWVQDVFPEIAAALGVRLARGMVGRVLARLRDASLAHADADVALGDLMAARLAALGVAPAKIRVIHNWSDGAAIRPLAAEANRLRAEWGLQGRYVVGYSGNMGRVHELAPLLDAAARLAGRDDIVFLFVGSGPQRAGLEARARGLSNVAFRPYQPRELLGESLAVPDCHVVSLKPALEGLVMPSKLYGSLAAGRPVLWLGARDGEIGTLLQRHDIGRQVAPGDVDALVDAVLWLADHRAESRRLGANGRALFESRFERAIAFAAWDELIDSFRA
jgi:glycosyltransferase involved in cell wall biosynthesis